MKKIKTLHIGNIANNAYSNAKFLREKGIEADVICYDYYHVMATPEWEDAEIDGDYGDDSSPTFTKDNTRDFKRPSWFIQGSLKSIAQKRYGIILPDILTKLENIFNEKNPLSKSAYYMKEKLYPNFSRRKERYQKLISEFNDVFPNRTDKLTLKDFEVYDSNLKYFIEIFKNYDLVQAYGCDPIYPLLANFHPYVAFEHGTIRDIPFEDSPTGRLTALAYRKADKVIITNPDNSVAAKKLGLKNFVYIPHPIDDCKEKAREKLNLKKKLGTDYLFFAPARQNWEIKGSDIIIFGYSLFLKKNSELNTKLILTDWGQDIQKSKNLILKLKIEKNIVWVSSLCRRKLREYFKESDVILDQFKGYFGAIAPEAMLFKKPVITWFDKQIYAWAFSEMPPVLLAQNPESVDQYLKRLVKNKNYLKTIANRSHHWYKKYHSESVVTKKLLKVYEEIL